MPPGIDVMTPVVTADEMRRCDRTAIETYGIHGPLLMENAGAAAARFIRERFILSPQTPVVVVCGKGNNGGDGFVIARHLLNSLAPIVVFMLGEEGALSPDAAANYRLLANLQPAYKEQLSMRVWNSKRIPAQPCSVIVDAIFGTGFHGEPSGDALKAIQWMNRQIATRIAVDCPSGLDATTGDASGEAVQADFTVTFAFHKVGLLTGRGKLLSGSIHAVDIGIPARACCEELPSHFITTPGYVQSVLPKRSPVMHKYSAGKVLVLAGAEGYTGAAALAASAVLKAGAGAVMLGVPKSIYGILAKKLTSEIVFPLPCTPEGSFHADAVKALGKRIDWADVVAVGPGLSRNEDTIRFVHHLGAAVKGKCLFDADALFALAAEPLKMHPPQKASWIVTPHTGEFAQLSGLSAEQVESDRVTVARAFAQQKNITVVLKGPGTVIASPDGTIVINPTGNDGMATIGSGDVLTGILAAFWSQKIGPFEAAVAAAYLHGLAGDMAREKEGARSMTADSILKYIPDAFQSIDRKN